MKITKQQLKQIIKEEISKVLSDDEKLAAAMDYLGPEQIKGIKDELTWEAEGGSYSPEDLKARIIHIYSQAHGTKPIDSDRPGTFHDPENPAAWHKR